MDSTEDESLDYESQIEKWKKELTPSKYKNFDEFDQFQKDNASFLRCCQSKQGVSLFFHCDDCCLAPDGVYCAFCFNETNHVNHHVSFFFGTCAFCDCGDPKTIREENWCSHHGRELIKEELPEENYIILFKTKVKEIFDILLKYPQSDTFLKSLQFLYNFTDWGSFYINLISEILFEGNWENSIYGQMIRNYKNYLPQNIESLGTFFFKAVVSPTFKRGYTNFLNETFKILTFIYFEENFPKSLLEAFDFSFQCFHESENLIYFQSYNSFLTKLINLFASIFKCPHFKRKDKYVITTEVKHELHSLFSSIIRIVMDNVMMFQYLVNDSDYLKALCHLMSINSKNSIIRRKRSEKVAINTNIHILQSNNLLDMRFIWNIFTNHLPMITVNVDEDINYNELFDMPIESINDSHIITLNSIFSIFCEELESFLDEIKESSNSFKSTSFYIQPYIDSYIFDHPLAKLIVSSASCFSLYNSVNPFTIFDRINFNKFYQLAAIFASCEAGKYQIINDLFLLNDDSLQNVANFYDDFCLSSLSELQAIISMKEEFAGEIVIIIAESFGVSIWENLSIDEPVDCRRWTNVMTAMLRLFINLSCNDNFFNFHLDLEKMKKIVVDYVYCGENNRLKVIDRTRTFTSEILIIDKAIEEVVDIRIDNNGSHFTLKPEYDDTSSVFSANFTSKEFNKMLAYEIANHKGVLPRLSPIDPPIDTFPFLKSYLQTKEMKVLIHRILTTMLSCTDKFSVSCAHTIFALIRLILMESETPEETGNEFIQIGIIHNLIKLVKLLENGILYLQNFSNECIEKYSKITEIVDKEIENEVKKKNESKKKIDKSKILEKFLKDQKNFASANKDELNTIENTSSSSFNCAFCGEQFNSSGTYGIMASLFLSSLLHKIEQRDYNVYFCQIRTCGHWAHYNCYHQMNQEEDIQDDNFEIPCPLDRSKSNVIIPVFEGNEPDTACIEQIKQLSIKIFLICFLSAQECLAYNLSLIEILNRHNPKYIDDKRTILCMIHFIRACFFVDIIEDNHDITEDPFMKFTIEFCSGGNLQDARKKFDSILPSFWHNLVSIASVNSSDRNEQLLLIQTYIRRASLLEQITFYSDSDSIFLPTVSEFIESHQLKSIDDEMKTVSNPIENYFNLSPCVKYSFPNLKENFTEYILSYKIILTNKKPNVEFCQCMLCGKLCFLNKLIPNIENGSDDPIVSFFEHASKCFKNLGSLILLITGNYASSVFYYDGTLKRFNKCLPIYTDKYGDENVGLKHGNILILNKSRVSQLLEDLITGELKRKIEI